MIVQLMRNEFENVISKYQWQMFNLNFIQDRK